MFVFVSDRFFFSAFTMSLRGVTQGLDDNGNPIIPVLSPAAESAVTNLLRLLEKNPELVLVGLFHLGKYNHYPCPFPVVEDQSNRQFAVQIVSILAFHGHDPNLLAECPTALQVIYDWACKPDPHGFIDGMMAKLMAVPPSRTYLIHGHFSCSLHHHSLVRDRICSGWP